MTLSAVFLEIQSKAVRPGSTEQYLNAATAVAPLERYAGWVEAAQPDRWNQCGNESRWTMVLLRTSR